MSKSHSEDRARWMIVVFRRHSCQFGEEIDESARDDDDHDWRGEEDGASWKPSKRERRGNRVIIRTKLFIAWYNDEKEGENEERWSREWQRKRLHHAIIGSFR